MLESLPQDRGQSFYQKSPFRLFGSVLLFPVFPGASCHPAGGPDGSNRKKRHAWRFSQISRNVRVVSKNARVAPGSTPLIGVPATRESADLPTRMAFTWAALTKSSMPLLRWARTSLSHPPSLIPLVTLPSSDPARSTTGPPRERRCLAFFSHRPAALLRTAPAPPRTPRSQTPCSRPPRRP